MCMISPYMENQHRQASQKLAARYIKGVKRIQRKQQKVSTFHKFGLHKLSFLAQNKKKQQVKRKGQKVKEMIQFSEKTYFGKEFGAFIEKHKY